MAEEPIAIIGMGCRFAPDASTPAEFWAMLAEGRDAVREVPAGRWDPYLDGDPETAATVRRATRFGAFLGDVEGFDAAFFGISPREAPSIDPQQRILLEVTWEALEDAGIPPHTLRGTPAGVFVAANSHDYGDRLMADLPRLEAWAVNGAYAFGIANRVSFTLDLRGPSMAIDTACAGSLTALHAACQHLWRAETDLAVAGGVNVMAAPGILIALDAAGATAPDGRSKAFDSAADGYGRGEGAGVVVLKRLRDARRDGDRVLALIRGGGVFHDGAGGGLMAPNGEAQEHMLREVYARSGVPPETIDYVETHGTGTPAGDPVEAATLSRFFGVLRGPGEPCLIGSVKPNIGHLEAGAGIAGVIKTVMAMRNGQLPPSLHDELTGAVDWDRAGLRVVPSLVPWPERGRARRAGVSSFGVGGTITHVILEEAPPADAPGAAGPPGPWLFPLSSMSGAGVAAQAARLADWLDEHPDAPLASVGYTLARRRSHLPCRATVAAASAAQLAAGLRAVEPPAPVSAALLTGADPAWVFSGHGAQWTGMGRQLMAREPVFARVMADLEDIYRTSLGFSPAEAITEGDWSDVGRVQAMTFAMQAGLAEVWRSRGVRPGAIIGHSVGEISAAVVAGVLDRDEAALFACCRAAIIRRAAGLGGMAMAALPFEKAAERLAGRRDVVPAIAAAPSWTVISGGMAALEEVTARWAAEGIVIRRVGTDVPFHSAFMDPLLGDVAAAAAGLTSAPARVPLYSTVTQDPRSPAARDGAYWTAMLRDPVRFTGAVAAAAEDGHRIFTEISSHPIVTHSLSDILAGLGIDDAAVGYSLRRGEPELEALLAGIGAAHAAGAHVDWARLYPAGALVSLPPMAWQHRGYWASPPRGRGTGGGHDPGSHTLLGTRTVVNGSRPLRLWQTYLDFGCRPYPGAHPVRGVEIVPAAVLLATLLRAAETAARTPAALRDVDLRIPLAVTEPRLVQVVLDDRNLRLSSRLAGTRSDGDDDEHEWLTHTTAVADGAPAGRSPAGGASGGAPAGPVPGETEGEWRTLDARLRGRGVGGYGFDWQVAEFSLGGDELTCVLSAPPEPGQSWAPLLDGALTVASALLPGDDLLRMPSNIGQVIVRGEPPPHARLRVWAGRGPGAAMDLLLTGESGEARVRGLMFGLLDGTPGADAPPQRLVHELTWRPFVPDAEPGPLADPVVLMGDDDGYLDVLAQAGVLCLRADTPERAAAAGPGLVLIAPAAGTGPPAAAAERNAWTLIRTAQMLAELPRPPLLCCLTRAGDLAHAPLHGIGRIIAGEHPGLWGGLLEVSVMPTGERLVRVLSALAGGREDAIAVTGAGDFAARLTPVARPPERPPASCRPDGTYLVTGGLGALGLAVARWLTDRGARRLVLAGRRGLPPRSGWDSVTDPAVLARIEAVQGLEKLGATVRVLALDIADAEQAAAALDPAALGLPPVRGVVHAAGVNRDALLAKIRRPVLAEVMRPKAEGAMVLHRLFPPGTLDFFVMFSSCGQFARVTGQAAYAAANSFLDALAASRDDAISFGWMTWHGMGMSGANRAGLAEANARGLDAVSQDEAFRAWQFAERFGGRYFAVARVLPVPRPLPVLSEMAVTGEPGPAQAPSPDGLAGLTAEDLAADLRAQVAAELRMNPEDIHPRRPLPEMGVDSVLLVTLRARLLRRYGVDLPPTILWNQPTISALAGYLNDQRPGLGENLDDFGARYCRAAGRPVRSSRPRVHARRLAPRARQDPRRFHDRVLTGARRNVDLLALPARQDRDEGPQDVQQRIRRVLPASAGHAQVRPAGLRPARAHGVPDADEAAVRAPAGAVAGGCGRGHHRGPHPPDRRARARGLRGGTGHAADNPRGRRRGRAHGGRAEPDPRADQQPVGAPAGGQGPKQVLASVRLDALGRDHPGA